MRTERCELSAVRANVEGEEVVRETAIDVVRRAADGEIGRDELVRILKSWHYEPQYETTGLAEDWETVPNSFDAVEFAYI